MVFILSGALQEIVEYSLLTRRLAKSLFSSKLLMQRYDDVPSPRIDKLDDTGPDQLCIPYKHVFTVRTGRMSDTMAASPPKSWTDPTTSYKIHRLSEVAGSSSLYFNYNAYTPDGDYLVISTPSGLSKVQLNPPSLELTEIISIDQPFNFLFTGHTTRTAYYELQAATGQEGGKKRVMAVEIDSGKSRVIANVLSGHIQSINSDETLLGGVEADATFRPDVQEAFEVRDPRYDQADYRATHPDGTKMTYHEAKEYHMIRRYEAHVPTTIFTIDTQSGKRTDIYTCNEWMNHLLFSPTDPLLLLYCHEGPWHRLHRLWLIRVGVEGAKPECIHERTMDMEIAGHEWWSADGQTVWYDLQQPKGQVFYVAGFNVNSRKRTWYHIENRNDWGVHFHSSRDDKRFAGDGGAENMVARASDGKWLCLFEPVTIEDTDMGDRTVPGGKEKLIQGGNFKTTRLVDMGQQDYRMEPNVNFSPDGRWLVFRANFHGELQVYAVDLGAAS